MVCSSFRAKKYILFDNDSVNIDISLAHSTPLDVFFHVDVEFAMGHRHMLTETCENWCWSFLGVLKKTCFSLIKGLFLQLFYVHSTSSRVLFHGGSESGGSEDPRQLEVGQIDKMRQVGTYSCYPLKCGCTHPWVPSWHLIVPPWYPRFGQNLRYHAQKPSRYCTCVFSLTLNLTICTAFWHTPGIVNSSVDARNRVKILEKLTKLWNSIETAKMAKFDLIKV